MMVTIRRLADSQCIAVGSNIISRQIPRQLCVHPSQFTVHTVHQYDMIRYAKQTFNVFSLSHVYSINIKPFEHKLFRNKKPNVWKIREGGPSPVVSAICSGKDSTYGLKPGVKQ